MKLSTLFLVVSMIVIAACTDSDSSKEGTPSRPPQQVSITELSVSAVELNMVLPGRITPYRQSQVRPQVDGVITKRLFEEGAQVKQGQQLYQIDDVRYLAQLNSAQADLKSAQANLKTMLARSARYKDLIKKNAISQQDFDDATAQTAQARAAISVTEAAIAIAQVNLDYTKVYAPIDGKISRSYVTEGGLVTTNQTQQLAIITQLDPVYIDMQESGTAILELREQMQIQRVLPVSILLSENAEHDYPHMGEVKFSEVTVDQTTGSVTLRALIPNPDSLLLPGLFVKAKVHTDTIDAIVVPQRATTRMPDNTLNVFLVDANNQVIVRAIKPVKTLGANYLVTQGLSEGEKLIVVGYQKVKPGDTVRTMIWQQPDESQAHFSSNPTP